MKKCFWITLFFTLLFNLQLYCISAYPADNLSVENIRQENSSFISSKNYNCLFGILPSSQVFFNLVPESPVVFILYLKAESFHSVNNTLKIRTIIKFSHYHFSFFSRYCSGFVQIFLRTACFRL